MSDHYGGEENPHEPIKIIEYYKLGINIGEGKIEDLKKAIWYLGRDR